VTTTALVAPKTVKICGIREPAHAVAAAQAGADLIGFIFAPTRRKVEPETALAAIEQARAASPAIRAVGVFVNETVAEINEIADTAGLDLVQLNGDQVAEQLAGVNRPAILALRPAPGATSGEIAQTISSLANQGKRIAGFLIDGYHPKEYGGHGSRADWTLATGISAIQPVLLAGGLDAGNVAEAITMVRPLGVDVSSGVETDGIKDAAKIAAFVAAARSAFG
jgi:phosphoribosylanthranilate isomerase